MGCTGPTRQRSTYLFHTTLPHLIIFMNDSVIAPTPVFPASRGLGPDELEELDILLDSLRSHAEEIPQWEFCDGFMTALVCSRRTILPAEYLPMLLGDGEPLTLADGQSLPLLAVFTSEEQQQRFITLWLQRWAAIEHSLDIPENQRNEDNGFQPEVEDMRAIIASLPEAERAELEGKEIPSLAQVWALGFMFAVENWPEEWAAPREKTAAQWLDESLECIVALTEDDTGKPSVNMYSSEEEPSISEARLDAFGDSIRAIYDLRQLWKALGPRVEALRKAPEPGRNDPCSCGSGKKFKKCCGA